MLVIGLTGGIGAGKSTVAGLLVERGAALVDTDLIARQVVEPGGLAFDAVVARFGPGILQPDGRIDRAALAAIVFNDSQALKDLNGITHPAVGKVMAGQVAVHAGTDDVVILDIPLLAERGREAFGVAGVIVVDTPVDVAVARLVEHRGFTEADARARVAAQVTREERLAIADVVVDNSGDLAHLRAEIDKAWAWIEDNRHATETATSP
jgi:dephospho-CoA kinase